MIVEKLGSIDYEEHGHGPTVVFAPGSCSTGAAWRPVIAAAGGALRSVTTSLLGYGGTRERRFGFEPDISAEAAVLESVIRRAAAPVHLVGHSFGGLVALAVALRNQVPLRSLTIVEAPAAELLRHAGEHDQYETFRRMTNTYVAAYESGDLDAIESMVDFYGGAGTFASWPKRVRDYALETTPVNILDWADVYGFDLTPELLSKIDVPTLVMFGQMSHPAAQAANRLLYRHIASASMVEVAGAAHFMISTHAENVARIIMCHVSLSELLNKTGCRLRLATRSETLRHDPFVRHEPQRKAANF